MAVGSVYLMIPSLCRAHRDAFHDWPLHHEAAACRLYRLAVTDIQRRRAFKLCAHLLKSFELSELRGADLTVADLDVLAAAMVSSDRREGVLAAIDSITFQRIGVVVFSASTCLAGSMVLRRIYSSNQQTYPINALTNKRQTSWGRHVLEERQVFVGEGRLAMAAAFDDQLHMESAGVHSIVNVPIVFDNRCAAVLNFGFASERVSTRELATVRYVSQLAEPAFIGWAPRQATAPGDLHV